MQEEQEQIDFILEDYELESNMIKYGIVYE